MEKIRIPKTTVERLHMALGLIRSAAVELHCIDVTEKTVVMSDVEMLLAEAETCLEELTEVCQ